jgi:hypothetical protein
MRKIGTVGISEQFVRLSAAGMLATSLQGCIYDHVWQTAPKSCPTKTPAPFYSANRKHPPTLILFVSLSNFGISENSDDVSFVIIDQTS